MFTGIIESLGTVTSISDTGHVRVATGFRDLVSGESVAVNGVCLTVTEYDASGEALFYMSPETLKRTSLGALRQGSRVNLERALAFGARLSGHWVQGHVDATAELSSAREEGESRRLEFLLPGDASRYCVEKGSIALDGISLTVNEVAPEGGRVRIAIQIIPHTWNHTTLGTTRPGDRVNVEYDVLAKYVESLCRPYTKP